MSTATEPDNTSLLKCRSNLGQKQILNTEWNLKYSQVDIASLQGDLKYYQKLICFHQKMVRRACDTNALLNMPKEF